MTIPTVSSNRQRRKAIMSGAEELRYVCRLCLEVLEDTRDPSVSKTLCWDNWGRYYCEDCANKFK